jgi:hypothetical protein
MYLSVLNSSNVAMHSHAKIVEEHGLPVEISVDQYAKVELTPDSNDYTSDPDTWKLKLDELRTPSWWQENHHVIRPMVIDAALKWQARLRALTKFVVEKDELLIVIDSSPSIKINDGTVSTYGNAAPMIMQDGGTVIAYENSRPIIMTQCGEVQTWRTSAPTIHLSNGTVTTYTESTPLIFQLGGMVVSYNRSAPRIIRKGGSVFSYGFSKPTIMEKPTCG